LATDAYFEQIEQKATLLLSEKKYLEAYELCKQVISKYPEERVFHKLKGKIEKEVAEENIKIVDEKIRDLKPLIKEEKYGEALKELKDLLKIAPDYSNLKKTYQNLQEKYKSKIEELQSKFNKEKIKRFDELLNDNPALLIDELYQLEKENSTNMSLRNLIKTYRDKVIKGKIEKRMDLIYSNKFEAIYSFINELQNIDKDNPQIAKLIMQVKSREHNRQLSEKSEYIYGGEKQLETLMKLKKYDKVIKAAEEIIKIDPNNIGIQRMLQKAQRKYFNQTRNKTIDSIYQNLESLKEAYKKNKSLFIRL